MFISQTRIHLHLTEGIYFFSALKVIEVKDRTI